MAIDIFSDMLLFAQTSDASEVVFDRRVMLIFPAALLFFLVPALIWRIFPTKLLFLTTFAATLLSTFLYVYNDFSPVLWAVDLALIAVLLVDLLTSLPVTGQPFSVRREVDRIASLARPHLIRLRIENRARWKFCLSVRDDVALSLCPDTDVFTERVLPRRSAETLEYEIEPKERGLFRLEEVSLRVRSRFGFWHRHITIPCESEICVYPNLRQMTEYDLLARTDRLHQLGVRVARRVGHDNDFERLRDYQLDDQYKFIDWSSTARRQKLTVKDFQVSRSQRIMFLVDCGRMMTNHSQNGLTLLDHSLNAALMLSYVAIRQFDAVGMLCFSNRVINYVPPATGQRQMSRLLHGFFNLFPEPVESRYDEAFAYLSSRCRKRSLVVLITNVADEVNAKTIQNHLTNITGRHLPMGLFLRDHKIFDPLNDFFGTLTETGSLTTQASAQQLATLAASQNEMIGSTTGLLAKTPEFWQAGAAADILNWRHKVINDLKHQGTLTLDVFPEEMTAPLINKYLEIKARQLL